MDGPTLDTSAFRTRIMTRSASKSLTTQNLMDEGGDGSFSQTLGATFRIAANLRRFAWPPWRLGFGVCGANLGMSWNFDIQNRSYSLSFLTHFIWIWFLEVIRKDEKPGELSRDIWKWWGFESLKVDIYHLTSERTVVLKFAAYKTSSTSWRNWSEWFEANTPRTQTHLKDFDWPTNQPTQTEC